MTKKYLLHTLQVAPLIWAALTLAVIASSILYASLNVAGVSEIASLLIAFATLVGLILLVPKSFLTVRRPAEDSILSNRQGQLEQRLTEARSLAELVLEERLQGEPHVLIHEQLGMGKTALLKNLLEQQRKAEREKVALLEELRRSLAEQSGAA